MVKVADTERRRHEGRPRLESEEACIAAVAGGAIADGDVLVIRNEGPAGGPACARC